MTDFTGYYQIPEVEPGTYRVCEEMQDGLGTGGRRFGLCGGD